MRALKTKNEEAVLITYKQACERYSLGMNTVMKLARTGECLIKIGKSARITAMKMDDFIKSFSV